MLMSTVVFVLMYLLISTVTRQLGVGFLGILFLLSYPLFILWYSFGMAPTCIPMVPTCLLGDIIATMQGLIPEKIVFPDNLLYHDPKTDKDCLKSCEELGFISWIDPLAFAVCDTDPRTCHYLNSLGDTGVDIIDSIAWTPARTAMQRFVKVVDSESGLAGYRLCTWVSFVTATPVLALLLLAVVLTNAVLASLLDLIPSIIAFYGQLYIFYKS
jgi:hypothetical protein